MRLVSFDDFLDMPRPGVDWLIEGLIPRPGLIELMGPPKVGKSFLALDVAFKIARGEDFLGRPSKPSNVLYLQLDTSERVMRDRGIELRAAGYSTTAPLLHLIHPQDTMRPLNIMTATSQVYLRQAINTCNPELIVIDTLREIHQEDENDSTAMKQVMDALEALTIGRTLLLVHHTNKFPQEITHPNPILASRGSTYITGKVDAYWLLYNGRLSVTARWDEALEYNAQQTSSGMFEFPDTLPFSQQQTKVLELCKLNPTLRHNDIAKLAVAQLRISRATFFRVLQSVQCVHATPQPAATAPSRTTTHLSDA